MVKNPGPSNGRKLLPPLGLRGGWFWNPMSAIGMGKGLLDKKVALDRRV